MNSWVSDSDSNRAQRQAAISSNCSEIYAERNESMSRGGHIEGVQCACARVAIAGGPSLGYRLRFSDAGRICGSRNEGWTWLDIWCAHAFELRGAPQVSFDKALNASSTRRETNLENIVQIEIVPFC